MTEKVEVEWIATGAGMLQVIEKMNARLERQEKQLEKIGETSIKASNSAIGSFKRLEQELKQNEAALKRMTMGTAEFSAQKAKVDALKTSLAGAKNELKQTSSAFSGLGAKAIAQVTQVAAGLVGMQQILSAVVSEFEKVKKLNLDSAAATRTVEQSIARMAPNIGADNVMTARNMISREATGLGVTQEGLAAMLASAMSSGAKDLTEALELSAKALAVTAGNATEATPLMSGMLTLAAQTGERNWDALLGQFAQFQQASRGESMSASVTNMATAMAAANLKGERLAPLGGERTLEIGSQISQLLQDPTMALTGTALRSMFQKMDAFVPETKATLDDGTKSVLTKQAVDSFSKLGTLDERIAAMQANPEIGRQFLSKIEENQVKPAIRAIVTGDARAKDLDRLASQTIGSGQQAAEFGNKLTREIKAQTMLTRVENKSQANIQATETDALRGAEGQATKIVSDTLSKVNLSGLDAFRQQEADVAMSTSTNKIDTGIQLLTDLQNKTTLLNSGLVPLGGQVAEGDRKLMQEQIELLKQIKAELAARNAAPIPVKVNVAGAGARPKSVPLPAATAP